VFGDCRRFGRVFGFSILALAASATFARAQEADTAAVGQQQNLITANPFGYVFGWYNVEYEREVGSGKTLGFTASTASPGNDRVVAGNAIFRFYPQGNAFRGLYLGGRTGAYYVDELFDEGVFFGAGFEIGYTWLMGARKNWYLGLGAGVTRIFGGEVDGSGVIPQVRLVNFGYSF
jgi:hypothetical protein